MTLLIVCRHIVINSKKLSRMSDTVLNSKKLSCMSDTVLKRLGARLRHLRQAQGISQEGLADLAGLHRTYIGGVERGERNISLINLLALGEALGISLSTLVDGVDYDDVPCRPPPQGSAVQ